MKLRYIPNLLTILRIVACVPLVILKPFSLPYIILFTFAAVTDTFDGIFARNINGAKSELGAILDSVADILLVTVIFFRIMPEMHLWAWVQIACIFLLVSKIIISTGVGYIRFKIFMSLHTLSFKLLVVILFSLPFLYYVVGFIVGEQIVVDITNIYMSVVIVYGLLVVLEEILIISLLKKPDRNIKSIFNVKAANLAVAEDNM